MHPVVTTWCPIVTTWHPLIFTIWNTFFASKTTLLFWVSLIIKFASNFTQLSPLHTNSKTTSHQLIHFLTLFEVLQGTGLPSEGFSKDTGPHYQLWHVGGAGRGFWGVNEVKEPVHHVSKNGIGHVGKGSRESF